MFKATSVNIYQMPHVASDRDLHWFTSVSFDGLKYRLGSDFYPMIFGTFLFVN